MLFLFKHTLGVFTAPIKTELKLEKEGKKLMKRLLSQMQEKASIVRINDKNFFEVTHPLTKMGYNIQVKASL